MNLCYFFSISQFPAMVVNESGRPIEVYWHLYNPATHARKSGMKVEEFVITRNLKKDNVKVDHNKSSQYFNLPPDGGYVSIRHPEEKDFTHLRIHPSEILYFITKDKFQYA